MPNDDVLRLAVIGQILRRRRRLLVTIAVLGAVLGGAASLLWPPVYESSSRVLLRGDNDKARVLGEVHLATSMVVLDRVAAGVNWGIDGSSLQDSVRAEVVDGNLIEITAAAERPERARRLAEELTRQYIAFSTEITTQSASAANELLIPRRDSLEKQIAELNRSIAALQGSALLTAADQRGAAARDELAQMSSSRTQAVNELNSVEGRIAQVQAQAAISRQNFTVIEPPELPRAPAARPRLLLVAGGAVLAAGLGAFVLVVSRQIDRRLRRGPDIAAALGAPLLGTVEAPTGGEVVPPMNGSPDGHDAGRQGRWRVPNGARGATTDRDQSLEQVRYRRVLSRLRGGHDESVRLLVVIIDSDVLASRAVDQLVAAAADTGTDQARTRPVAVLDAVSVSATRPTIPESAECSEVLVVVTSGTRTAWELLGVAEACHDAGHPVTGVLMVLPEIGADELQDLDFDQVRASAAVGGPGGRAGGDPA